MKPNRKSDLKTGRGWAWQLEDGRLYLRIRSKPSTEAKPVFVRIIKESDWRKMRGKCAPRAH